MLRPKIYLRRRSAHVIRLELNVRWRGNRDSLVAVLGGSVRTFEDWRVQHVLDETKTKKQLTRNEICGEGYEDNVNYVVSWSN